MHRELNIFYCHWTLLFAVNGAMECEIVVQTRIHLSIILQ